MNLYWAYHGVEFKPLGRHANWDDAAHYADGALPGWHSVVNAGQLLALHEQIGTQLGQRIPASQLYLHADEYLHAVELKGATSTLATSARARLVAFIRQFAKGK
jgi:hypothetical protein